MTKHHSLAIYGLLHAQQHIRPERQAAAPLGTRRAFARRRPVNVSVMRLGSTLAPIKKRAMGATLIGLTVLATVGMFSGSDEPLPDALRNTRLAPFAYYLHTGNSIVFNLSVGYLGGVFLWLLVSWLPERRRKSILRENLSRQYQGFKEEVIRILLRAASDAYDCELEKKLSHHEEFKKYFSENRNECWYAAVNGLEANQGLLQDLAIEIELLATEVTYVLNNVPIDDDEVHSFLRRLTTYVYKLRNSSVYSQDQVKYLTNFVWELLARWSFLTGQRERDIVQDTIEQI